MKEECVYKKYEPIFGSWYITEKVGEGAIAKVYAMERRELGITYHSALKAITIPVTEDEVKAAFLRVVNSLITDRGEVLAELRAVRDTFSSTEELEAEQRRLAEQMNADADAVERLIAENARVVQDQEEYSLRYEALGSRFEDTKAKYERVTAEIAAKGIRKRELERFIQSVEKMPDMVTEFDEALWGSLVDHLTVHSKDNIVFTLTSGMEIKA